MRKGINGAFNPKNPGLNTPYESIAHNDELWLAKDDLDPTFIRHA